MSKLRGMLLRANRAGQPGDRAGGKREAPPDPNDWAWLGPRLALLQEVVVPQLEAAAQHRYPAAVVTVAHASIGGPDLRDKRGREHRVPCWCFKLRRTGDMSAAPDVELRWPWDTDPGQMLMELDAKLAAAGW